MSKKAVSPIVSSVLLIVFAVALGIVVMSWGKSAVTVEEKGASCIQASLNVIKIAEKSKICFKDSISYLTIENNGQIKITGFKVSFIGDSIYQKDVVKGMVVGEIIDAKVDFSDVGKIQKIKIIPKITAEGKERVCPNSGVEIENIGECQNA